MCLAEWKFCLFTLLILPAFSGQAILFPGDRCSTEDNKSKTVLGYSLYWGRAIRPTRDPDSPARPCGFYLFWLCPASTNPRLDRYHPLAAVVVHDQVGGLSQSVDVLPLNLQIMFFPSLESTLQFHNDFPFSYYAV
jgi:hypothetical protein